MPVASGDADPIPGVAMLVCAVPSAAPSAVTTSSIAVAKKPFISTSVFSKEALRTLTGEDTQARPDHFKY
jgi:hypothetical protein